MGREAMIRADMESVGIYSPIFDATIRQLAKTERELSRAEKTWRANGGQMVAELVNKTGGKYTAKDPHYAVVDQLRKDILALRNQLGLTPASLKKAQARQEAALAGRKSRLEELLEAARDYALEHASGADKVRLTKQQKKLQEQSLEIQKYEEKIHHLADKNIPIDLDDGVKHNYALFGDVLAKIK